MIINFFFIKLLSFFFGYDEAKGTWLTQINLAHEARVKLLKEGKLTFHC